MLQSVGPGVIEAFDGFPPEDRIPLITKITELAVNSMEELARMPTITGLPHGHVIEITLEETRSRYTIGFGLTQNPEAITIWFVRRSLTIMEEPDFSVRMHTRLVNIKKVVTRRHRKSK